MGSLQWSIAASLGGSSAVHEKKPKHPHMELAAFLLHNNSSRTSRFSSSCRTCSLSCLSKCLAVTLDWAVEETWPNRGSQLLMFASTRIRWLLIALQSISISAAKDWSLRRVCHAMWLSRPCHEHTTTFHPGSASSTPEWRSEDILCAVP